VDYKVVPAFGIDVMGRIVVGFFKEVANQVFMKLLRFGIVGPIE
jgi:hypothetical protein